MPRSDVSGRRVALHLGEAAGVAHALVEGLNQIGFRAEHRGLPTPAATAGTVTKLLRVAPRMNAARHLRSMIREADAIAHVHFATAGVWFMGCHPLVVHCHGSDVRSPDGVRRVALKRIFASADLVIAATPDLLPVLPDSARHLPNPIDMAAFAPTKGPGEAERDVLVFAGLTDIKGAPEILAVVRHLRRLRSDVRITAIDHGPYADAFRQAGVDMVPFMSASEIPRLISDHRVVLGQRVLGTPGMSELQAMACGRPVVMPLVATPGQDVPPPVVADRDPGEAAAQVIGLLDDNVWFSDLAAGAREWVASRHATERVCRTLVDWYGEIA